MSLIPEENKTSAILLVFANIVPIFGVLFWNWNTFDVFILFWSESVIIGFYSIFKILIYYQNKILAMFFSIFFIFHFGIFLTVHLLIIIAMFSNYFVHSFNPSNEIFIKALSESSVILSGFIFLFISHGVSFFQNYIGKKEYKISNPFNNPMVTPYVRIIIMHIALIFGGFLLIITKASINGLIILILFKIIIDLKGHNNSHKLKIN